MGESSLKINFKTETFWYYVVGRKSLVQYFFGFASICIIGCAIQELTKTPIGSIVQILSGALVGIVRDGGLKEYTGIPYAAPPVGALRWAPQ